MSESGTDYKTISLVIRVRNDRRELHRCLTELRRQILPDGAGLEIVVVDNESTDNSADVARSLGAQVVFLPTREFSWGGALNRGIEAASGGIVLILSADACPAGNNWIQEMIGPFECPAVAAVYGRQIPRPDAPIDEIVRLYKSFSSASCRYDCIPAGFTAGGGAIPVSNACAAIRKDVWRTIRYDENISGGEEGIWTFKTLEKGYSIVYQAGAVVYHSHKDSIFRYAWRNLELMHKNCELNNVSFDIWKLMYNMASLAKRRTANCLMPMEVPFARRMTGLLRLPAEIIVLAIAYFTYKKRGAAKAVRHLFWR